ncbi:MAG: PilC/PilY family type IV pilus protein, partial [Porticoccaceae bacterium]|nr:PilC/PilY family type IV pilus protein [Porticoccaceae bacterium]
LTVSSSGVGDARWSAAAGLNSDQTTADGREIITYNDTQGIPFRWPADHNSPTNTELSAAQIADLTFGITDPAQESAFGLDMLNFIRGDHAQEMQQTNDIRQFRNRLGSRLGDVVHSAPVFVGTPDARYPDDIAGSSNPYSDFIRNNDNRRQMIYVGANDGMLHAFDANNGSEVFAYIPSFLFSSNSAREGLHYLADDDYAHRSYVDLTPTAQDVFVNGAWRTYLAGGARAGGRGVYVLDVTNPGTLSNAENNASNIVVTEFDSDDDADLGFTYSQITIALMNNGRWAAIFGNGYNNTGDGTAKIFVLYLDSTGGYVELETGVGDNDASTAIENNGMSTPEVLDLDNNGTADRIYAGDVLGNMWAFDVSSSSSNAWGSAYGSAPVYTPFFAAGSSQPITSKPSVDAHPTRSLRATSPNLLVTFGTGQYLTDSDISTSNVQTFYGVWDAGVGSLGRN